MTVDRLARFARTLSTILMGATLAALAPGVSFAQEAVAKKPAFQTIPTKVKAWRVALVDADGDGAEEILYVGYGGEVICQKPDGRVVWQSDIGGFPYHFGTADLDGDGKPEILISSSSLALYAFKADGRLLWEFDAGFPIIGFDVSQTGPKAPQVLAGGVGPKVFVLDAKGKQVDELPWSQTESCDDVFFADFVGDDAAEYATSRRVGVLTVKDAETGKALFNSGHYERAFRMGKAFALWNADADPKMELLETRIGWERKGGLRHCKLAVFLTDNDGKELWRRIKNVGPTVNAIYEEGKIALFDIDGDGRQEAAVQIASTLAVYDADGEELYFGQCGRDVTFTDMAAGADGRLAIGSAMNGDDRSVYLARFEQRDRDDFAAFKLDHGRHAKIMANLRGIHAQVMAAKADPEAPMRHASIHLSGPGNMNADRAKELFPYDHIDFIGMYGNAGDHKERAQDFVDAKAKHLVNISHGLKTYNRQKVKDPFARINEYFDIVGDLCVGMSFAETSALLRPVHEKDSLEYMKTFMVPMMDMAVERKLDVVLWQKQVWWAAIPAMKIYRDIFAERFQPYIVARTEESNSRSPEINFIARVGLRQVGIVRDWECNVIRDLWRTLTTFLLEYDYNYPSGWLRQMVAYGAAGATGYRVQYDIGHRDEAGVYQLDPDRDMDLIFETFVHMLGKGLLVPPTTDEIAGLSPVVIRLREPHFALMRDTAGNTEDQTPDPEGRTGLITGFYWWAFTESHDEYLPRYTMGVKTHSHDFIPTTPYGLPTIVPAWTPAERLGWASHIIDTDGVFVYHGEKKLTAAQAKTGLLTEFEKGARRLPLRTSDVYCMTTRRDEKTFRAYVVDPGVFDPAPQDRDVVMTAGEGRTIASIRDVLSDETITAAAPDQFPLHVPAGAFRILDVTFK